ncbi:MAG: hypothetical protein IJT94_10850 [Oscillibacter sp.]|nr:hypothetical protein [Oscillibacter sp.]
MIILDYATRIGLILALLSVAFGGRVPPLRFLPRRWGRPDAQAVPGIEDGTPEAGTEKEPEAVPPDQAQGNEPPDEEMRRRLERQERALAEQEAFRQVMNYNENAAYGIEPDFPAVRR